MSQETYSEKSAKILPDIDDRDRGILFSIFLMLNLYSALAQTGFAFWRFLINSLDYPINLFSLLIFVVVSFYLMVVLGLLNWKKWAYSAFIGILIVAIIYLFFIGQFVAVGIGLAEVLIFVVLSYRKLELFD